MWKKKWNESDGACKNSRSQAEISKNDASHNHKSNKKVEMKQVQCYWCQIFDTMLGIVTSTKNQMEMKKLYKNVFMLEAVT